MQTANATAEYATIYYAINTYLLNDHLFLNFVYFVDLNETINTNSKIVCSLNSNKLYTRMYDSARAHTTYILAY